MGSRDRVCRDSPEDAGLVDRAILRRMRPAILRLIGEVGRWQLQCPPPASSMAIADSPGPANVMPGVTRFRRLRAVGHFQDEKLTLEFGQIALASATGRSQAVTPGIQSISGTVTFSRVLDLRMQPAGVSITGPLDKPVMKARTSKATGKRRCGEFRKSLRHSAYSYFALVPEAVSRARLRRRRNISYRR